MHCRHMFLVLFLCATTSSYGTVVTSEAAITMDVGKALAHPLYKSKLGFARAMSFKELPTSVDGLREIRPRVFCSEIDFDDVEDKNYALEPDPFQGGNPELIANSWLRDLDSRLTRLGITTYYQLIGAPTPYQQEVIRRPAIHPVPTDISKSAELTARWISVNFPNARGRSWLIWNEPCHTLRGAPTLAAARDMAEIVRSYSEQIRRYDPDAQIGYASFIAHAMTVVPKEGTASFLNRVLEATDRLLPIHKSINFITLNSYFGKTDELLMHVDELLRRFGSAAPIVIAQYAPPDVAVKNIPKNTITSAVQYIASYDRFVQNRAVKSVCFSYWSGPTEKAFYRYIPKTRLFVYQLNYHALSLYQQLATWRAPLVYENPITHGYLPSIGSFDDGKIALLTANTSSRRVTVSIQVKNSTAKVSKANLISATRTGLLTSEQPIADLSLPLRVELPPESINLVTIPYANKVDVQNLREGVGLEYMHSTTFVHRHKDRKDQGSAFYDSQDHRFVGEVILPTDIAHSRATFYSLPQRFRIEVTAPAKRDLEEFKKCGSLYVTSRRNPATVLHLKHPINELHQAETSGNENTVTRRSMPISLELKGGKLESEVDISLLGSTDGPYAVDFLIKNCRAHVQAAAQLTL